MASLFQSQLSVIYQTQEPGWIIDGYMKCRVWLKTHPVVVPAPACCLRPLGDVRVTVEVTLRIIQAVLLTCSWYKK